MTIPKIEVSESKGGHGPQRYCGQGATHLIGAMNLKVPFGLAFYAAVSANQQIKAISSDSGVNLRGRWRKE